MSTIVWILVVVLVVGAGLAIYAFAAPRLVQAARVRRETTELQATTDWTHEAGAEFAGLSEAARCDLVFAVAALDDERSRQLLDHALRDPAEPVALAAAHALHARGEGQRVDAFLREHPGERAERISATLTLLGTEPAP